MTSRLAVAALCATPALALDVSETATVAAPPATVWKTIGEFCGIGDWHPAVEKCELSEKGGKRVRTLSLKGGGTIVEKQAARDEKTMDYTYAILESPPASTESCWSPVRFARHRSPW